MNLPETKARGRVLLYLLDNRRDRTIGLQTMRRGLDNLDVSLSIEELALLVEDLEERGYVTLKRRKDIPGYSKKLDSPGGGRASDVVTVTLTPKGTDFAQGNLLADPGVDLRL